MENKEERIAKARKLELQNFDEIENEENDINFEEAAEYYSQAMENGDLKATFIMGWLYEKGLGVKKDIHKTIALYQKCADNGAVEAKIRLADIYKFGFGGVVADQEKAVRLYREAANDGDLSAMYSLGTAYSMGKGVRQDKTMAFEWYRRAAKGGDRGAMEMLGILYQEGDGVEKDEEQAREWFRKAGVEEEHFPDPEKERQRELFFRCSMTQDREEFIGLTMQLFPQMGRAEAEKMADELDHF